MSLQLADLVIFDLETTSADPRHAEIIELAAIKNGIEFHRFLETNKELPRDLYAFRHLDYERYQDEKILAEHALQEFLEFIGDAPLCGHNIYRYDLPVLKNALQADRLEPPKGIDSAIDTLRWAHLCFPIPPEKLIGYTLGHLLEFLTGEKLENAHEALNDCRATEKVAAALLDYPLEPALLRLWTWLDLPESRFYRGQPLTAAELNNLHKIIARVPYLNHQGNAFPSVKELFPHWVSHGLERHTFTLEMLHQALLAVQQGTAPIGFSSHEAAQLKTIAQLLPNYRPPQGEMAHLIDQALMGQHSKVMVQAPTGTGKTKGYIFPALHHQSQQSITIIATHTKVLQQQAMNELGDLAKKGFTVRASSVKSAKDNICNEALEEAITDHLKTDTSLAFLAEDDVYRSMGAARAVLVGLLREHEFDLESLPVYWQNMPEFRELRLAVQTVSSRCRKECDFFQHCAFQTDKRQREGSSLWVTNQAYLLSKLAQEQEQPNTSKTMHLIIDEAHNLEDVATDCFTRISRSEEVRFVLKRLYDSKTQKGILASNRLENGAVQINNAKLIEQVGQNTTLRDLASYIRQRLLPEAQRRFDEYDEQMVAFLKQNAKGDVQFGATYTLKMTRTPEWMRLLRFEGFWRNALLDLRIALQEIKNHFPKMRHKLEPVLDFYKAHADMLQERRDAFPRAQQGENTGTLEPPDDWLYLTTLHKDNTWEHVAQPINLEPFLTPLWQQTKSVSLTSATLLPGANDDFAYFKKVLHLDDIVTRRLAETLPYNKAHIVLPKHLPEARGSSMTRFVQLQQEELKNLLPQVPRSLSLFTARERMEGSKQVLEKIPSISAQIHAPLTRRERESVSQTLGNPAHRQQKAVALGTRAFMEGVDFYDLNLVGLEKIPFPPPTPLLERRQAMIEKSEGHDAAWQYYFGKAMLTLTQAFGRLIRDDRAMSGDGAFVLWDKRLLSAIYYLDVLETLPRKFHRGQQVYLPKNRAEFYERLSSIWQQPLNGYDDTLQDEVTRRYRQMLQAYWAGEIALEKALEELHALFWEKRSLKPEQTKAINAALEQRDALVLLPTGFGKSLTFQAPALLEDGLTVVISPLIALMKDQVGDLLARGAPVAAIYAGMAGAEQRSLVQQAEDGEIKLLYLSPERVNKNDDLQEMLRRVAMAGKLKRLVYDEAHCLSEWGFDFRPDYQRVKSKLHELGLNEFSVACLTATATQKVQDDLRKSLALRDPEVITANNDRSNIQYFTDRFIGGRDDRSADSEKIRTVIQIVEWAKAEYGDEYAIIVYAMTRKKTESVARALSSRLQQPVEAYHAGLSPLIRSERQDRFMEGTTKVMVATNAFGMGVDKNNVRVVIHYQPPSNLPAYIQEAGRGGRDGKPSFAILFYSSSDWRTLEWIGAVGQPERHHAEALVKILNRANGKVRLYEWEIVEQINDHLELEDHKRNIDHDKKRSHLEPEGILRLHNTMQQAGLLEYSYELGKGRLMIGDWSLLAPLEQYHFTALEKLGVREDSKKRQFELDFTKLKIAEAENLASALHELKRRADNPMLFFAMSEASIGLTLQPDGDLSEFEQIIAQRIQQRQGDIEQMKLYASRNTCKRQMLLAAFDQELASRDKATCCGSCNDDNRPWAKVPKITDEELVQILKPNRAILEFMRDHRRERLAWLERKRKIDPSLLIPYNGIGTRRISMVLRGEESENIGTIKVELKFYEHNSRHFGTLIGTTHKEIDKTISLLTSRGLLLEQPYGAGFMYQISEKGLSELEKTSKRGKEI